MSCRQVYDREVTYLSLYSYLKYRGGMRVWECRAKKWYGIGNNIFWWGGMHQENVI